MIADRLRGLRAAVGETVRSSRATMRRSGFAVVALAAGWLVGVYAQSNPMKVIDLHEVDGVAVRGGVLDLSAVVDQRRLCVTSVRRWLWRPTPDAPGSVDWVFLPGAPFRPPSPRGIDRYILKVPVPAYTPAGLWHYLGEPTDDCSPVRAALAAVDPFGWMATQRQSSDVLVRIEDPTQAQPAEIVAPPGVVTVVPTQPSNP